MEDPEHPEVVRHLPEDEVISFPCFKPELLVRFDFIVRYDGGQWRILPVLNLPDGCERIRAGERYATSGVEDLVIYFWRGLMEI